MKKAGSLFLFCFLYLGSQAQSVAVINGKELSLKEFNWVYQRHRPDKSAPNLDDLISFLNIYIDFKLKVQDAIAAKMDQDSSFLAETGSYQAALQQQLKVKPGQEHEKMLMNELKDALLFYSITQQKIWEAANHSENGMLSFYTSHQSSYQDRPFEEVRDEVTEDYQHELECQWINSLRTRYRVSINQHLLGSLVR